MKKLNKKSIYAFTAIGAMSATLFGGTAYYGAYLTDQEKVTNTITYGSVETELEEPNWPGNGTPEVLNTMPNQEIQKNPQVENVGKNSAITFLVMEVPVKNVTMVTDEGKKGEKKPQEVFFFKDDADVAMAYKRTTKFRKKPKSKSSIMEEFGFTTEDLAERTEPEWDDDFEF